LLPERLLLESLEQRRVLAAVPTVVFANDPPASAIDQSFVRLETDPLIGQTNAFTLRFDNTSTTDTGFGPYVDLYMPVTGVDGAGAAEDDGISFVSATYLGQPLATREITLTADAAGVAHPFAKDASGNPRMIKLADLPGFKAGDKLVVLELPLGSVTPGQPPVDIVVTTQVSNKADLGAPLGIRAQAGFRFGGDSLNNPTVDPPLLGAAATQSFAPALFNLTKENLAPEYETATGPNFERKFKIRVDVADGQTLTNLTLRDVLPNTLQFVSATVTGGGSVTNVVTPSTTVPGGTLERLLSSVAGTASTADAVMEITYYVPLNDAASAAVLNATTGDDRAIPNSATGQGASWQPLDTRDPLVNPVPPVTVVTTGPEGVWNPDAEQQLVAKSIATQKSVSVPAGGATPGAILTYTINFQISDYFAFENLKLTDLLGDGQTFVPGSATLTVNDGHGVGDTTTGAFAGANVALTPNKNPVDGKDEIVFDVSAELDDRGFSPNGRLVGGLVPDGGGALPGTTNFGGTTGTITFQARVQNDYDGTVATGDKPLDPGDLLDNTVTISGDLLNVATLMANGQSEADGSYAWTRVPMTQFAKSVYAKNGVVGSYPASTLVPPGDTITYRITFTLPTAEFENLKITDYLPLPTFLAAQVSGGPVSTTPSATAPVAGRWSYGPSDTFRALRGADPTVSTTVLGNSVVFDYGTYDDPAFPSQSAVIDLLFTVEANAAPFADGLKLANRASATSNNSANEQELAQAIAEVTSSTPELAITKGIVATDNSKGVFSPTTKGPVAFNAPGTAGARWTTGTINSTNLATSPVNSNLAAVDNGDLVTYAIVVENRGSGKYGAFDVAIKDSPAAGMAIPAAGLNLRVTTGAGTLLVEGVDYDVVGAGFFDGGIVLRDPSATQGGIPRGKDDGGATVANGSNVIVITYDMQVLENTVLARLTNTAAVTKYAAEESGPDFTGTGSLTDPAVITIGPDNIFKKLLVGTSINDVGTGGQNANNEAVVGEIVTYSVTLTVPEARMPNAKIVDTLDSRLAFVEMVSVTTSAGVSFTGSSVPVPTNNGQTLTFDLGTITNSDTNNAVTETITFVYKAVVLNVTNAQGGQTAQNSARLTFDGIPSAKTSRASAVTIIEPQVAVTKTAKYDDNGATGDAGDAITYTVKLKNPVGAQASTADAFDLTFSDPLPKSSTGRSLILSPTFTVADTAGIVNASMFELFGDNSSGWILRTKNGTTFDLPVSNTREITLTIKGTLSEEVVPGQVITNTATSEWTSLDGDPGQISSYNTNSTERTGSGSPALNDYRGSSSADLKVTGLGLEKTIVATSESATSDATRVVPGEIVRYRLVAVIPEGTTATTSARIVDALPAGLQFLNDGTAKIALVSNGGLTASLYTKPGAAYVTGTTDTGVTPGFVITSGIFGGPFGDGTDVSFDLGAVTNTDSDADLEYAIVEFNALVLNVASNGVTNGVGNTLANSFRIQRDGVLGTPSAAVNVRVAEGLLESPLKTAVETDDTTPAAGPFDAGDVVRYRIDVQAASGADRATLYNVALADPLATGLVLDPTTVRVLRNGTATAFTNSSTSGQVAITLAEVNPGDAITVLYDVTLQNSVAAGTSIPNTATITGTSLPGPSGTPSNPTGSTVPGTSGQTTGERDGSGGAVNDYRVTAGTTIAVAAPELDKTVFETSPVETTSNQFDPDVPDFAVGEIVTYRLTVTLPEGVTPSVVVTDVLPAGLMQFFTSGGVPQVRVAAIGGNITGSALSVGQLITPSGNTATFTFGTLTNAPDGVVNDADKIVLEVEAQVLDVVANKAGSTVTNVGNLSYAVGGTTVTTSDSETAEIVEPVLETIKEIVTGPTSTVDSLQVNRGDTVTYRVTVRHAPSSTAPAFSVKIADTLPAGLTLVGTPTVVSHPNYPSSFYTPPVITTNVGGNANAFTVLFDYLDHPESPFGAGIVDEAIIEYQATVDGAIADGPATNTAQVTYDSLYGERSSIISPTTTRDYADSDPATLLVDVSSIAGHVYVDANNNGIFDPGETPLAGVTITLIGTSTVGSVSLTATTDASGGYIFSDLDPGTYTLSQPTQPAGYADGKDHVGTIFGGTVAGTGIGSDQITTIVIPNDGETYSANDYDFGEVEVDLSVTKTSGPATYVPGENVVYTIVVTNKSLVDLTGVTVADTFDPARVANAAWTVSFSAGSSGPRSGTGTISDTIALKAGETATYTVTALTRSTATGNLVNTATVQTPSGTTDKTPGDNTDTETDVAAPKADLRISKTDGVTKYSPGVPLTYTIVVTNDGPSFVTDARVLDDLPAVFTNASWKVTSYTGTGSGPGTGGPALNVAQSGDIDTKINLAAGGTATFTVTATVDSSASGDLVNTARVEEPAGVTDPTPDNNTATDVDEFQPLIDLAITKTDGREIAQAGAATTYTIVVTNNGPGTAVGARVFDAVPANMTAGSWTATYSPGSNGDDAGTGALDTTVTLLPGGAAIFTVVTTVKATASGQVKNTATVEKPAGTIDTDLTNNSATDTNRIPILVAASDADCNGTSQVSIIDPFTGAIRRQFFAYEPNFRGGVRVTLADVDGDGIEEIVTAPGVGRATEVRVFNQNGVELTQYRNRPYGNAYNGGAELAAGDVDGDGDDDVVTAMTRGAGDVRVLQSGGGRLTVDGTKSFRPFAPTFRGGATVAMADLNGDRKTEVIVGSGAGMAPSVLVYNVAGAAPAVIDRINPFTSTMRGGVAVAASRWNADATPDIIVSGGRGAGSVTEIYDGTVSPAANARLARQTAFAGLASRNAATFAAGLDIDGDNRADRFFAAQGGGGSATGVRVFDAAGSQVGSFAAGLRAPLRIAASAPRRDTSLVTTATGLQYRDVKVGTGAVATSGQYVKVHYVGSLRNGTVFDSSRDRRGGNPFDFRLGVGQVIDGWDEGVAGMKVGGRRTLIIPANLAYEGKSGPQGTLVFDVELLEVRSTPFP